MDAIASFIKDNAGIFLVLLTLGIGIGFFVFSQSFQNSAKNKTGAISQTVTQIEFSSYDNTTVAGTDVYKALQEFKATDNLTVRVYTLTSPFGAIGAPAGIILYNKFGKSFIANNGVAVAAAPFVVPTTPVSNLPPTGLGTMVYTNDILDSSKGFFFIPDMSEFSSKVYRDPTGVVRLIELTQVA
jgi:hypothetical protein